MTDDIMLIVNGQAYNCTPITEPAPTPDVPVAFSQRDARWSGLSLGVSIYAVGSAGCAVVAATMLATMAQPDITPHDMVTWLNWNEGFTRPDANGQNAGLLKWSTLAAHIDGMSVLHYHKWRDGPADIDIVRDALARNPQVVQVDFKPATSALDTHFVLALDMTDDDSDIDIIDPWTGQHTTLLTAYGRDGWTLPRAVYAMCEFELDA